MANYSFNLKKIIEFISQNNNDSNTEITETWVPLEEDADGSTTLSLVSKELHESKGENNNSSETIRYDLIRTFINYLNTEGFNINDNDAIMGTFFQRMVFHSMKNEGLIVE